MHQYGRILSSPAHWLSPRMCGPPVRFLDILGRIGTPAKTYNHLFHRAFPSSIAPYNGCPKGHALSLQHLELDPAEACRETAAIFQHDISYSKNSFSVASILIRRSFSSFYFVALSFNRIMAPVKRHPHTRFLLLWQLKVLPGGISCLLDYIKCFLRNLEYINQDAYLDVLRIVSPIDRPSVRKSILCSWGYSFRVLLSGLSPTPLKSQECKQH